MAAHDYEILDPRFEALINTEEPVVHLADGCIWAEGPAWLENGRAVIWSDIPNDRMLRWDEATGEATTYRQPASNSNGNFIDRQGRMLTAEHRGRRVTRTGLDGSISVVVDNYQGKRFNSPNDVVEKSNGTIWFTDPTYGIDTDREGKASPSEIGSNNVYRFDPASGDVRAMATDFVQPNGLAFDPDESKLYVVDTGATHVKNGPKHIRVFDVGPDDELTGGDVFCTCQNGLFDGFRFDSDGRIWTSAGDGVHCYEPDGTLIGKIKLPEPSANVVFGGDNLERLFICATSSLYGVHLNVTGARLK